MGNVEVANWPFRDCEETEIDAVSNCTMGLF